MHLPLLPSVVLVAALALLWAPYGVTGQGCVPVEPVNTSLVCPELENITRPTVPILLNGTSQILPDAPEFYDMLSDLMCKDCNGFANKQWICSLIFLYYVKIGGCPAAGSKQPLPCLTDCKSAEIRCSDTRSDKIANYTETINCPVSLNDNNGCQQNRKGDFCNRPPFLLRKTAGAPNWVWIFIVGVGGLILLIIIGAVIILCLKLESFMTLINPCKWCECCPGYYDL